MPLGLAQQGARLYLVCRFDGYDNERSLALHRIQKATVSTFNFQRPKEFKLSQYDADGRFGFGEGELVKLSFSINKQAGLYLAETPLSKDQIMNQTEDRIDTLATVIKSRLLEQWLEGFGSHVWDIKLMNINE